MQLVERVGWPREPAKWALLLQLGPGYLARTEAGTSSGMVVLPEHDGATWVAMLAVDPAAQRQGVGRRLLQHAFGRACSPFMLYATEQGRPLYERLGFAEIDQVTKHIGYAQVRRMPTGIRLAGAADRAWIAASDASAFGVPRPRLVHALLAQTQRAVVDAHGGFALRWFNGDVTVIGPVVARDEPAAIALVDAALEGCDVRVRIDVVRASASLAAHLTALGLQASPPAPLMVQPHLERLRPGPQYHAIALQAVG